MQSDITRKKIAGISGITDAEIETRRQQFITALGECSGNTKYWFDLQVQALADKLIASGMILTRHIAIKQAEQAIAAVVFYVDENYE